ncbi:2-iminoacetate synthase ThiH [Vibrio parahaemolyticus]|uniref:2-iminoacetate synthase ThiH n=1 Tax=Vibrio parahaemolyticus TaxID=670 RepID=UPI0002A55784|nr:2-iminoacetate synthase ThiH [Vibrio parahaemolyticus]EJG0875428.1 2-iminoacetate synthase ThiH [Vibrio parahaemolyticus O3]EJG0904056.1 2-iminoacetate synthase ThiH [Vibrio parahaemolyticus O3:K56]EJG1076880.1 2-iminoacetate synthase ThiH [Vibrio parahaemolyticus O1:K56]RFD45455.1 thiamine biosynthesis protein ThiH [Vibrio parahaemolyticus 3355]AGB11300.1 Thiazole biosynthesis protein ThiH [Vibrio parahaemolyticus BB22OP]
MSFYDRFQQLDWDDISMSIYAKTAQDVERALAKPKRDLEDFKALISPAAEPYLEQMAKLSYSLTRKRFGNTMSLYIPLYLSNLCANACTYCGFSMENRIKRRTLNRDEVEAEIDAIKRMKFDSVLLVTGEHETKVGMKYFREMVPIIKQRFNYLAMEVQPLDQDEYAELKTLGLDAVMVYQETYHPKTYAQHHLRGNKMDFRYRLETPDRLAKAGIDKIGIGALIGLEEWRTDCFFAAAHLDYLERTYWQSRYSISFPRLRPCAGNVPASGLQPKSVMTDKQLVQLICAYRLFNPEVELSLSTRESPQFRDNVLPLGITSMSAASKTQPGGYATEEVELEQFEISDERSAASVEDMIRAKGFDPVWRDWHSAYSG